MKKKKYKYNHYISSPYIEVGLHGAVARGIVWQKKDGVLDLKNERRKKCLK